MAQSSNLFGFFLEAAKDTGASAVESVTSFADALTSALSAGKPAGERSDEVLSKVLRAVGQIDTPTVTQIMAKTGLPLDVVAGALDTAQRIGLLRSRTVGDAIAYDATSEGKKLM